MWFDTVGLSWFVDVCVLPPVLTKFIVSPARWHYVNCAKLREQINFVALYEDWAEGDSRT